jgi:hypothetical protein
MKHKRPKKQSRRRKKFEVIDDSYASYIVEDTTDVLDDISSWFSSIGKKISDIMYKKPSVTYKYPDGKKYIPDEWD